MTKNLQLSDPFWTSGLVNRVEEFWGRDAELGGLDQWELVSHRSSR